MSALREFLKSDYMAKQKSNGQKGPDATATKDAAVSTKSAVAVEKRTDAAVLQAKIKSRLAAVAGPYKAAVAKNGTDAEELKEAFDFVKTSALKGEFADAAEGLDELEEMLDQRKNPAPGALDGMDMGPVQAGWVKDGYDIIKQEKDGKGIVNYQRETKIIIENHSGKVLEYIKHEWTDHKRAKWRTEPPPTIAAAKDGKPGVGILILITKGFRGGAKGDTSGWVSYKVVGEAKETKVIMKWVRTSGGKRDLSGAAEGRYHLDWQKSDLEEFTFQLTEIAPATKPKDPQPPADPKSPDPKPKDPQTPAQPKITPRTIVVGSFAFGDDTVAKITPIGDMLDYNKLSAWYKNLPEATRIKIMNGEPPGGKKIVLTGFTDNVGSEHNNLELGKKRALAVADLFETISGVPWSKFVATPSNGEQDVREENKNLEKKEPKHRRVKVEIHIEE